MQVIIKLRKSWDHRSHTGAFPTVQQPGSDGVSRHFTEHSLGLLGDRPQAPKYKETPVLEFRKLISLLTLTVRQQNN